MKNYKLILYSIIFLLTNITFSSCKKNDKTHNYTIDKGFINYIDSYTTGTISVKSSIEININQDSLLADVMNKNLDENFISIKPNIKGKLTWSSLGNIRFTPDKQFDNDKEYNIEFKLHKLMKVPKSLSILKFGIHTKKQDIAVFTEGLEAYDTQNIIKQKYTGYIISSDYIEDKKIEKILLAKHNGLKKEITWIHNKSKTKHKFTINNIIRKKTNTTLRLQWDCSYIDIDDIETHKIDIPSINTFTITKAKVVQQPEQYISIYFSDPINTKQNLDGLIRLNYNIKLKFIIQKNEIKAFPTHRLSGTYKLTISEGIKNSIGTSLKNDTEIDVKFENIKPAVRLIGKGVISPSSKGLIFPFEAVGLKAIDLRIIEVFEKNINSFFQENNFDNHNNIKKVARLILDKKINLAKNRLVNFNNWNSFTLDISDYIKINKGSIYNIEIRFNKKYSVYKTSDINIFSENEKIQKDIQFKQEIKKWDKPLYYSSYYYPENYSWEDRNNPSSDSYYTSNRFTNKNIFASNMGIIAKMGNNNNITFAVSNLLDSEPINNVKIEIYNYQNQLLETGKTNKEGLLKIQVSSKPFLMKAIKGKERAYLKLNDASSLSLSNFDVSGQIINEGIKAYIYGERDVWRPGDNIFLSFILEDKKNTLPANHPVIFTLSNPKGQITTQIVKTKGLNGFYNFTCSTDKEAPTGKWIAKVQIGDANFYKNIKIETVKPNRLKINLDFETKVLYSTNKTQKAKLNVKWLHGATARNMKSNIKLLFTTTKTKFDSYRNYIFDDETKQFKTEEKIIFDSKINNNGDAEINLKLKANKTAPGMLKANFITRVFEQGGDYSINMQNIPFAPYSSFVGMKLPPSHRGWYTMGHNHTIDIVSLDDKGKAINRKNLSLKVYKLAWSWWWESDNNNIANYINRRSSRLVTSKIINTKNGKASCDINIKYNSWRDWGRYLIQITDPISKHSTSSIVYFSEYYGKVPDGAMSMATQLSFVSDKNKYTVGEKAKITIPSSKAGKALVSIETGSKILNTFWVKTEAGKTDFSFEINSEMAPNAYVSISLIQNHDQTENDKPIRMYGIIPIMVEDPDTRLEPEITINKILEPEKNFVVKVKEKKGKHMTYTIAIVDDGLLDLTNYKTPQPWNIFYAREALGIKTWDMYDMVMGAYGARLEKAFAVGGDESLDGKTAKKANRFKPVVMVYGPFDLKSNTSKTHKFKMPNYVGSVRTMVVAGYKGAYGNTEYTSQVRKPLMILASLPRVLGPSETVKLPVNIFAMDPKVKNVKIKIIPNELISVVGASNKEITFKKTGDKIINFDLKVAKKIGIGKIKIIAESIGKTANYEVELDVRNPNPKITKIQDTIVLPGQSWKMKTMGIGMKGTNTSTLEISNIPAINLSDRLDYLISYPHGCIEQTTSSVFPQLFINKLSNVGEKENAKMANNIMIALNKFKKFQTNSGGFSYWPGDSNANQWGTNYAGHFFLKAEEAGYALAPGMKEKWVKYQVNKARNWKYNNKKQYRSEELIQAYRLFTLALAGKEQLGAMNRLREKQNISKQAKWRLATAYAIVGQKETAEEIINQLTSNIDTYNELSGSFGSSTRDMAMILESLSIIGDKTRAFPLVEKISELLSSDKWMSTQTTAYSLLAVSEFIGGEGNFDKLKFSYIIDGKKRNVNSLLPISQIKLDISKKDKNIEIINTTDKIIYARVVSTGIPITGDKTNANRNLQMDVTYTDISGNKVNIDNIKQASDIIANIRVQNTGITGTYEQLALVQIFPSGWEIVNTRFGDISQKGNKGKADYIDIRDDRVYTYFALKQGEVKYFKVLLNASYQGKFYLPSVSCQAMYDNNIHSHKSGQWINIIK